MKKTLMPHTTWGENQTNEAYWHHTSTGPRFQPVFEIMNIYKTGDVFV